MPLGGTHVGVSHLCDSGPGAWPAAGPRAAKLVAHVGNPGGSEAVEMLEGRTKGGNTHTHTHNLWLTP